MIIPLTVTKNVLMQNYKVANLQHANMMFRENFYIKMRLTIP